MSSNTYCSLQRAPERAKHRSKGFRESEPHNLLAGLDWFSCTTLLDETANTPQGIKEPSASPLRTSSSRCFLFHTCVQSALSHSCTEQAFLPWTYPCNSTSTAGKCQQTPPWRQRAYCCHKTLCLITLFHTPIFFYNEETRSSFHFKVWQSEEQSKSFQQTWRAYNLFYPWRNNF